MTPRSCEVVEVPGQPAEVSPEALGVAGVAEHPRLLEPVRCQQAPLVEPVQVVGPLGVPAGGHLHEPPGGRRGVGVHRGEGVEQVGPPALEPQVEGLAALGGEAGEEVVGGGPDVVGSAHREH